MVVECMECRKHEEDIYWSRFQTVQFCLVLSGKFNQQIEIPKKFVNNVREKMAGTVSLSGPSGNLWNVGLVSADGYTLFLKHGWETFVKDHLLEENDVLIFKYGGDSRFDVSIFDQESHCEKIASYFVKKCEHVESVGRGRKRKSLEEVSEDDSPNDDIIADDSRVRLTRSVAARPTPLRTQPTRSAAKSVEHGKKQRSLEEISEDESPDDDIIAARTPPLKRQPTRSTARRGRRVATTRRRNRRSGQVFQLKSQRREVTEDEKQKAYEMATAASSDGSFLVVMRASHVYKGFFMSIPADWARVHLPKKSWDIELRVKDKTWRAKYEYKGYGGGLSGAGWKNFVLGNILEEFDVCVFNLVSGPHDAHIIMDVKIFRVVEEVIPPTKVTQNTLGENYFSWEVDEGRDGPIG